MEYRVQTLEIGNRKKNLAADQLKLPDKMELIIGDEVDIDNKLFKGKSEKDLKKFKEKFNIKANRD